jgi:hypothetical protein
MYINDFHLTSFHSSIIYIFKFQIIYPFFNSTTAPFTSKIKTERDKKTEGEIIDS